MQKKIIENYKIISLLGKGGMGSVYKAYDMKLDRYVAIKILNSQITDKPHFIERFKREAKNQAQLVHPNVVTVYGFIETEDTLGIVMEYVEGECLDKIIYEQGKIHIYDAIFMMRQILSGIGYAHSKGFVHRDIKPSNIIFNQEEGITKIMDFGISKSLFDKGMTKTSAKVGTVLYMSPEQIHGEEISHETDIYSLGITLYEMITGQPPFLYDSEYEVMEAHVKAPFPQIESLEISKEINQIIGKAVRKNPEERYFSCDDFYNQFNIVDPYLEKIKDMHKGKKKRRNPTIVKIYSVLAFTLFSVLFIFLAYFVYGKVHQMLSGNELDKFKKYSFDVLFEDNEKIFNEPEFLKSGINTPIERLFFSDSYTGYALSKAGKVLQTEDGGQTWKNLPLENHSVLKDFVVLQNGKSFIVGENSKFLIKDNNNSKWQRRIIKGNKTLSRIRFIDSKVGFILGNKGFILRTEDGGISWQEINSTSDQYLYDICKVNENRFFIVGWNGTVLKTEDKGKNWKIIDGFTKNYLKSVAFKDDKLGVIVGGGGEIYKTLNGGDSWSAIKMEQNVPLNKVIVYKDRFIAVGDKGMFLISKDSIEWEKFDLGTFVKLSDVFITEKGNLFICGSKGTIIKL